MRLYQLTFLKLLVNPEGLQNNCTFMTVFFKVLGSFFSLEFWLWVIFKSLQEWPIVRADRTLSCALWWTQVRMFIWCKCLSLRLWGTTRLQTPRDRGLVNTGHCWVAVSEQAWWRNTYLQDPASQYKLLSWPVSTHGPEVLLVDRDASELLVLTTDTLSSPAEPFSKFGQQTSWFRSTQLHTY